MEVVLSACALSQMALYFINRYSKRRPHIAATPSTRQNGDEKGQIVEEREEEETDVVSTVEPLEEGSIAALEAKLKSLRTEAKLLTSPDSFVQYAKVSREANKVEKVLKQKKGTSSLVFCYKYQICTLLLRLGCCDMRSKLTACICHSF